MLQLQERREGNAKYRAGEYKSALKSYERALSVVELVRGLSRGDQAEVDVNRIAVLCNIAAVHLATEEYGAAAEACTKALELNPHCVKALMRRYKAYIGRHEYVGAMQDVKALERMGEEVGELLAAMKHAKKKDIKSEKSTFGSMFDRQS